MNSPVSRFLVRLTQDPRSAARAIPSHLRRLHDAALDGVFQAGGTLLSSVLPVGAAARLQRGFAPTVRLDYPACRISLHADSALALFRARACAKEPETVRWIEGTFRPNEVFYDVGANVGAYSLIAAKHLHQQIQIYAFEPSFSTFYDLVRNIILNDCQGSIAAYHLALAGTSGPVTLAYSSLEAGSANHRTSSAAGPGALKTAGTYVQTVMGFSIDDLVRSRGFPVPNHLKLDVDGSEAEILHGAAVTLRDRRVRSILVEVRTVDDQDHAIPSALREFGFRLAGEHQHSDGPVSNYVFARE